MKTYPYHTPEGIILLVEKRELDQLVERLAEARESHFHASARDVQTIQRQAILLERLAGALEKMLYIIGVPSAGPETLWRTDDEVNEAYHTSLEALAAYESANLELVNPIDEVVRRMEAVPVDDLRDEYMETLDDEIHSFEDRDKPFTTEDLVNKALEAVRTSLIQAAKGEQI